MWAVFKKEVKAYFETPFGFIYMGIFLLITGIVFTTYNLVGAKGDMNGTFSLLANISIMSFPVLTMKLLSEERRQGTDRLLYTSRLSITSVILGKYFAALFLYLITLMITGVYVGIIAMYGDPNIGAILGSYFGFFILGATFTAICIFASSFTEHQVTAAITSFGILFALVIIGSLSATVKIPVISEILSALAITTYYEAFTKGIFSLGPIVYYISASVFFIFLAIQIVQGKRYGQGG